MYQVTIKGRNLDELKKAVADINDELQFNHLAGKVERDMTVAQTQEVLQAPTVDDMVEAKEEITQPVPTPVVTPPVVEQPVAPVVPISSDVELDADGLPWDKRIHAATKTKMKREGTWKIKRGVDPALVEQVKTELRGSVQALANPTPVPAPPVTPQTPVVEAPVVTPPVVEQPVAPAPVPTPAPTPVLPSNGGHTLETFKTNLPMIIATLISENKINQDYVNSLKAHFGIEELWLANDAQKEEMFAGFIEYGWITKAQ